jgi:hypothetical protein
MVESQNLFICIPGTSAVVVWCFRRGSMLLEKAHTFYLLSSHTLPRAITASSVPLLVFSLCRKLLKLKLMGEGGWTQWEDSKSCGPLSIPYSLDSCFSSYSIVHVSAFSHSPRPYSHYHSLQYRFLKGQTHDISNSFSVFLSNPRYFKKNTFVASKVLIATYSETILETSLQICTSNEYDACSILEYTVYTDNILFIHVMRYVFDILHGLEYGYITEQIQIYSNPWNEVETYKYWYIPVFIFEHVFYEVNSLTDTRQRHNTENLKQIFPEKDLRGLSPNFHIHVSVSDLIQYIPTIGLPILLQEKMWTDPGNI